MARLPRSRIDRDPAVRQQAAVPILMTMLASMVPLIPAIFSAPVVPPFGLMVFLAWRSLHRHLWAPWMGLLLGFWDDLFSGALVGTAMLTWTLILLGADILDRRMLWRDASQEWGLASVALSGAILAGALIASVEENAQLMLALVPQILCAALLFPLVVRLVDRIDVWRVKL